MEVIIQHNHTKSNYQYICDKYILPIWFDYRDIDWIRYYPMKDGKMYKKNIVKEEKSKNDHNLSNIYDDEKVNIYDIFRKYLAYVNNMSLVNDITDEEMEKLLNIKICDYDWNFMWSTPIYDKNSKELLLQKKLDESYIKHIIKEKYNEFEYDDIDIDTFIDIFKQLKINIGYNYICMKRRSEYGFNIYILDKTGKYIYRIFYETYNEDNNGHILTLYNRQLNIGYEEKMYSNRIENFINGIYHSTNEDPQITKIINNNTKLILLNKIYPTLSEFIINAYNNDSIILITEKELITLNKYIRETTC